MRNREIQLFNIIRAAFINGKVYFSLGFSESEASQLREVVSNAIPNPNNNEYPDFLTETATIELFEITSSIVNRKGGAAQIREKKQYDRKVMEEQLDIISYPVESEDDYSRQMVIIIYSTGMVK